jgi:Asp-tRNA(Asn)/Glu-tRNA(Gln) amidotransferase A subunit family amidase
MGRDVADTRLQLAASAGIGEGDPLGYEIAADTFLRPRGIDLGTLRVAYTEDFGICEVDDALRATFRTKIAALSKLVKACEPLDVDLGEADRCFDVIRAQSFVASFQEAYQRDPASLGPNTRSNYEQGQAMSLADVVWAHAEQTRLFRRFQAQFAHYDLIVSPTSSISPFPWEQPYLSAMNGRPLANYYRWLGLTYIVTLATNPALSLPCGLDHAGMPFGLQLVGAFRGDQRLLDIAGSFEAAFAADPAMRRPRPDPAKLLQAVPALKSIVTHPPFNDADTALRT